MSFCQGILNRLKSGNPVMPSWDAELHYVNQNVSDVLLPFNVLKRSLICIHVPI